MRDQKQFESLHRQIAERVVAFMADRGISTTDLARNAGVTPLTIERMIGMKNRPDLMTIFDISRGLGRPIVDLLPRSDTAECTSDPTAATLARIVRRLSPPQQAELIEHVREYTDFLHWKYRESGSWEFKGNLN